MTTDAEPDLPPYDPERILSAPFPEGVRLACITWASQVNPNPFIVVVMYWVKYFALYIGLGYSMGPMNARFIPPIGGYLYFLRPRVMKHVRISGDPASELAA